MVLEQISSSIRIKVYNKAKENQRLANDPKRIPNFLQKILFLFLFFSFPKSPFQDTRPVKIAIAEKCIEVKD
jgi:hypothetical protein